MARFKSNITISKVFSFTFAIVLLAAACTSADTIPANEVRAEKLNKVIMCPICPGESIDQATNDLSIQMRGIVRDQVEDNWTDNQIKEFWVERYGPSVILEPPREGFSLVAWLLPPLGIVSAALALFWTLRWMRRSPAVQSSGTSQNVQLTEKELSYYTQRIESILDSDDSETMLNKKSEFSRSGNEGAG